MKILSVLVLATLPFAGFANAAITPVLVSGSPTGSTTNPGDFTYNYSASTNGNSQLVSGNYATCASGTACGTFFTIYDFAGYVNNSIMAPTGWMGTINYTGETPAQGYCCTPIDGSTIQNLTFIYTGPPSPAVGPITGITGFSADSIYGTPSTLGLFTYQDEKTQPASTIEAGGGRIMVPGIPLGVPEPASMALIGGGLIGLAVLRRKFAR